MAYERITIELIVCEEDAWNYVKGADKLEGCKNHNSNRSNSSSLQQFLEEEMDQPGFIFAFPTFLTGNDLPNFSVGETIPWTLIQIRNPETLESWPDQRGEICVKAPEETEKAFVDGFFRTGDIGNYDANECYWKTSAAERSIVVVAPDVGGHVPRAFVTVHQSSDAKKDVEEEIKEYANAKLASYKHLRGAYTLLMNYARKNWKNITIAC
ncbi:putative 4-coumarate--CoA ligase 2 [Orchesella cincta]|uniref:Putative 4-coumarate--CoA ligase 2 n=1 Tax=Orchesella cincta TaxID=48709 RepID=A0A1D2M5H6_ORCCI|nr:putative 4-coumarate--CoA ligase 2 [Orchesella cincta]